MNCLFRKMQTVKGKGGFTLLEIIFALAILVIGIVGVLALFPVGLKSSKRAGDFTTATVLAQQIMEQVKGGGYGYTAIPSNSPTGIWYSDENGIPFNNPFAVPYDNFAFSAFETAVSGIANLNQVTLEIYWVDRNVIRSEQFFTYLANY